MDVDTIWRHIDAERTWLADLLESLPDEGWGHPSLCTGWTVRDVGAHLTFAQTPVAELLWPAVRAGFRYDVMIRDTALRSPLGHGEIVAALRGFVGSRRRISFITDLEPLLDTLIHIQDICRPLGVEHPMPRRPQPHLPIGCSRHPGRCGDGAASRASDGSPPTRTGPTAPGPRFTPPWSSTCSCSPADNRRRTSDRERSLRASTTYSACLTDVGLSSGQREPGRPGPARPAGRVGRRWQLSGRDPGPAGRGRARFCHARARAASASVSAVSTFRSPFPVRDP
jgi:uncharacterized protein (TIGR03083 family)